MRGEGKITSSHLDRTALIYLRQSTMLQVREHGESTARQYGLAGEAARLGWPASRIEVIDCDLGMSGRTATRREGFRQLLGRVCLGEAGAVFGLEISRLARSSADLSRLLELARLTGTLVIDADGIYDLADINDRLLLGLKGQMSEAELHLLHSRLAGAQRAAAARGDLRLALPPGYVHDDDGQVVKDPDEEVTAAVEDMFAAFTQAGSAYGVVAAFAARPFPARTAGGRTAWGTLSYGRAVHLLHNPAYAGAYAYGRKVTRQRVDPDGTIRASTRAVPRDQWQVLIRDHHEGYITWDRYLEIEAALAANQTSRGARPAREGAALCQGIIYCGCGQHMGVSYSQDRGYYECRARSGPQPQRLPGCQHASAAIIDAAVTAALFSALEPAELDLAIAAAGEVASRGDRAARAAELAVQRAIYQADRAEAAFTACDPRNRNVAARLETRWEARLAELTEAQAAHAAQLSAQAALPDPALLRGTAASLPGLWHAATTSSKDRKRLLRALLGDITLMPAADPAQLKIGLRWNSGATQELVIDRYQAHRISPAAITLARDLGPGMDNKALAAALSAAGHRTAAGRFFSTQDAANLRTYYTIPYPAPAAGQLTVSQAARRVGVSAQTIRYWISNGYLHARPGPGGRLTIPFPPDVEAACRQRASTSCHQHTDITAGPRRENEITITQAAARLGINPPRIYTWIKQGIIPARRGPGARWLITLTPQAEAECRQRINPPAQPSNHHIPERRAV
jgi:DNA invertase Pin-like site-specific DNA recombinase/transposase-like protein